MPLCLFLKKGKALGDGCGGGIVCVGHSFR